MKCENLSGHLLKFLLLSGIKINNKNVLTTPSNLDFGKSQASETGVLQNFYVDRLNVNNLAGDSFF